MTLAPGTRLGTHEILGPIGAGGMGEVYRAKDLRLGREVAIKVLPSDLASSPDRLARFQREARTVAALNHPNIVTIYSVEESGGVHLIAMELVDGQSLDHSLPPGGFPMAELLRIGMPLADALEAAHEAGIVHRDLKPANVMLTKQGRVKVLDFGLAKSVESVTDAHPTQVMTAAPISGVGMVLGTVPYMAPEQLRGEEVDARADLFAMGVLLYELATGSRPFTGKSSPEIMAAILKDEPKPVGERRSDLPKEFGRIVSRCLAKEPDDRYRTARDVRKDLEELQRELEWGNRPGSGEYSRIATEQAVASPEKIASIAVLSFANRSASADDEYFSDGLADEVLSVLSKIKGLRVTARASSFHFKGKDTPVAEMGRILNVATLLDGSVRKVGNRIRVSVHLVNVADSSNLWSETYDRTLDDIFAVQDEIAQSVVKELRTALLGVAADSEASGQARMDVAQAAKGRTTDPEAHRLLLLSRHLVARFTREDMTKAIEYLRQALDLDPKFALAWTELGLAHSAEAGAGWVPVAETMGRAREAVERALTLEPDLAEGHAANGMIQMYHDWDFRGAQASYNRALELTPGSALALRGAGWMALTLGRIEESIGFLRRALEQDPLSAPAYVNLGLALQASNRPAEAEVAFRKVLELAPQRFVTRANLSLTLLALGHGEEALAEALREPEEAYRLWAVAIIHHVTGRGPESDAALEELVKVWAESMAFQIAEVHGARGDLDHAFEWLERAYAQRDGGLVEMKSSPRLRSLHGDLRWGAYLSRAGLES